MAFNKTFVRNPAVPASDTQSQFGFRVEGQMDQIGVDLTAIQTELNKARVFASSTAVAPAVPGSPTDVEIAAFATTGSHRSVVLYFNGTAVAGTAATHIFHVDGAGAVSRLVAPVGSSSGLSMWGTGTVYAVNNMVVESNRIYRALTAHTAGVFATDLGAARWVEVSADLDSITSPDSNTFVTASNTSIAFTVEGNPVGGVVWDALSGMPKWTLNGALDPVAYAGTPRTIAQRNALTPTAGWLVYIVDTGVNEYQMWDGAAWVPLGVTPDRFHLADSAVSPTSPGNPTLAEVQAVVTTNTVTDTLAYYTGDDLPASTPSRAYWVDGSGVATAVLIPAADDWQLLGAAGALSAPGKYVLLAGGTYTMPSGAGAGSAISVVASAAGSVLSTAGSFFSSPGTVTSPWTLPLHTRIDLFSVGGDNWSAVKAFSGRVDFANGVASGVLGDVNALMVDIWVVDQTTASVAYTLPTPAAENTTLLTVHNTGTQAFTVNGSTVAVGGFLRVLWDGTAWVPEAIATFTGSASNGATAGTAGSVVAPPAGSYTSVLAGDGAWHENIQAYNAGGQWYTTGTVVYHLGDLWRRTAASGMSVGWDPLERANWERVTDNRGVQVVGGGLALIDPTRKSVVIASGTSTVVLSNPEPSDTHAHTVAVFNASGTCTVQDGGSTTIGTVAAGTTETWVWNDVALTWLRLAGESSLYRGSLASLAGLTALTTASLTAGEARRVGDTIWVWDPTATTSSGGVQPADTAFPGITPGYWVATSGHYKGAYSTSAPYSANDIVFHGGALWRANSAREAGVWGAAPIEAPSGFNSWTRVTSPVKGPFSSAQSYALGDVVYDASGLIGPVPGLYRADAAFTAGALPDMDTWSPIAVRPIYRGDYGAAEYAVGDVVHYLGDLYRCVVAHGSNSFGGPFTPANWSLLSAGPSWEFSTNNIQTVAGHWYIIDGAHTVLMPVAPVDGASVQFASPVEWSIRGATFTAAGATTVGAGQTGMFAGFDVIEMTYSATGDNWVVHVGSGSAPQADTIQNVNASATISAWGSVVVIGGTAPTANMILTLPVAAGNTGKTIKLVRVDNTAFTVTLAAQGDTVTLISAGSELNTQYGSLTLEATAATEIRQVAQVSAGGTTLYAGDGTISGVRTVTHDTLLRILGSGPTGGLVAIHNEGFVGAKGFQLSTSADHPTGAAPTYTPGQNNLSVMSVDALSTGIITVAVPTQIVGSHGASVATIQVRNDDTITRTVAWHADYLGFDGTTPMADMTVAAGSNRTFTFHETIRTGVIKYTLVADTSGISGIAGTSGADTIFDANTSSAVGAWNRVIVIGAVTPPTADMTITLPLIVTPGLSNIGKTIKIVRADNTAFTVTLTTPGGINLSVFNGASELNTQNGSITLEATSADHIRQVAQVGELSAPAASPVASFLRGSRSSGQSVAAGNAVVFTTVDESAGTDISLNTTTGHITLKAGKTYRLVGSVVSSTTSAQRTQWRWRNSTAGLGIGAAQVFYSPSDTAGNSASGSPATATISPTVDTDVILQNASLLTADAGGNTDFGAGASVHPWFEVEVIGGHESAVVVPVSPLHRANWYGSFTSGPLVNGGANTYLLSTATGSYDPNTLRSGETIVIEQSGVYRIFGTADASTGYSAVAIFINGVNSSVPAGDAWSAGDDWRSSVELIRGLTTGDIVSFSGSGGGNLHNASFSIEQLPTSTAVDPGAVTVNDQAASGYLDVGGVRQCWGTATTTAGTANITLPAAFANATYSVVATGTNGGGYTLRTDGRTTTTFQVQSYDHAGATDPTVTFCWIAIGVKP